METSVSIATLASLFAVVSAAVAIGTGLVRFGDRLWGSKTAKPATMVEQSALCAIQHGGLKDALVAQTQELSKLVVALQSQTHAAELRHTIMVHKLDQLLERTPLAGVLHRGVHETS
jgi:hypothetical protein